jgi:outer membrane scaffolding protein for murein synthesis (MipA/OmpV family)
MATLRPIVILILLVFSPLSVYGKATPLHHASNKGNVPLVKRLLKKGADIDARTRHGYTPLHIAVGKGHIKVAKLLITSGANTKLKDKKGRTPKDMAKKKSRRQVAYLFRPSAGSVEHRGFGRGRPPPPDLSITLGGLGLLRPEYEGSDRYEVIGFPLPSLNYKNIFFIGGQQAQGQGMGVNIIRSPFFTFGAGLNFYGDRDEDESPDLIGMGDIDAGLDASVFAMGRLGPFTARVNFRRDLFDNYDGSLVVARLGYGFSVARKARVILNVGTTYADENFMSTYFGVTDSQSSASGLPAFDADNGIKDVSVGANLIYPFYKNWVLLTFASYSRLLNDAAKSPLVANVGTENQFRMLFGIGYRFQFFGSKKKSGRPI